MRRGKGLRKYRARVPSAEQSRCLHVKSRETRGSGEPGGVPDRKVFLGGEKNRATRPARASVPELRLGQGLRGRGGVRTHRGLERAIAVSAFVSRVAMLENLRAGRFDSHGVGDR